MRLALGMIVRNEEKMLRLTLPVYAAQFQIRLALDTGSSDSTCMVLKDHGFTVLHTQWQDDFGKARNVLLELSERLAIDWLMQLDADECLWPHDAKSLQKACEMAKGDVIAFPRINLASGGTLQETGSYPDHQARCVRISSGKRYRLPVHEVMDGSKGIAAFNIFHYGFCKTPKENWTRSHNYELIAKGKGSIGSPDDNREWPTYQQWIEEMKNRHTFEPFTASHPLSGKL